MQAIVFSRYGSTDALTLQEVEKPVPRGDEVLVEVAAAAANRADLHVLGGMMRFSTGVRRPTQRILGSDIAGRVAAVGPRATRFQIGDAVFGDISAHGRGGFAEYVAVPETALTPKPANLTFAEAAAVPMTAVTALQGLRDRGRLQPGQRVLINGASGGVGTFAVQIARALGGEVTAVVSTRKIDMARALGADHVIDYTQEDFARGDRRYDLIFDTVGNRSVAEYKRALTERGTFITTTFLAPLVVVGPWLALRRGKTMRNMLARPRPEDLAYVAELVEAGAVRPIVDTCYPLRQAPVALDYLARGHARGKVVIVVAPG